MPIRALSSKNRRFVLAAALATSLTLPISAMPSGSYAPVKKIVEVLKTLLSDKPVKHVIDATVRRLKGEPKRQFVRESIDALSSKKITSAVEELDDLISLLDVPVADTDVGSIALSVDCDAPAEPVSEAESRDRDELRDLLAVLEEADEQLDAIQSRQETLMQWHARIVEEIPDGGTFVQVAAWKALEEDFSRLFDLTGPGGVPAKISGLHKRASDELRKLDQKSAAGERREQLAAFKCESKPPDILAPLVETWMQSLSTQEREARSFNQNRDRCFLAAEQVRVSEEHAQAARDTLSDVTEQGESRSGSSDAWGLRDTIALDLQTAEQARQWMSQNDCDEIMELPPRRIEEAEAEGDEESDSPEDLESELAGLVDEAFEENAEGRRERPSSEDARVYRRAGERALSNAGEVKGAFSQRAAQEETKALQEIQAAGVRTMQQASQNTKHRKMCLQAAAQVEASEAHAAETSAMHRAGTNPHAGRASQMSRAVANQARKWMKDNGC